MDVTHYQPGPNVLDHLKGVDFVAVVGPTASGKSSLMKAAADREPSLKLILTQTSRAPRPDEQDGVDAHFRPREEMEARIAQTGYVQVAPSLLGDLYATAPEDYPEEGVGVLAVLAEALHDFKALPFKSFRAVYVAPPSREVWELRLMKHGFSPDNLAKRLQEAKRSLEYALTDDTLQFIVNGDLDQAALDFIALIENHPLAPRLQADQANARNIIRDLLAKL